jgi:predicted nucleotidyltransferase
MIVTILKRYNEEGEYTHDMDVKLGVVTPDELRQSQWEVDEYVDLTELSQILKVQNTFIKMCDRLTKENEELKQRLKYLQYQS